MDIYGPPLITLIIHCFGNICIIKHTLHPQLHYKGSHSKFSISGCVIILTVENSETFTKCPTALEYSMIKNALLSGFE